MEPATNRDHDKDHSPAQDLAGKGRIPDAQEDADEGANAAPNEDTNPVPTRLRRHHQ